MSAGFQKLASKIDAANREAAERILADVAKYGEGSAMVIWARAVTGGRSVAVSDAKVTNTKETHIR